MVMCVKVIVINEPQYLELKILVEQIVSYRRIMKAVGGNV
jgi:hypothetical protein